MSATDEQLSAARDHVMKAVSMLANAASGTEPRKRTPFANDLYYAANRAWSELNTAKVRQAEPKESAAK